MLKSCSDPADTTCAMMTETMNDTFRSEPTFVRHDRVELLESAIEQITRRAAKLGVAAPVLELTGQERIERRQVRNGAGHYDEVKVRHVEVVVSGETPHLPGWKLIAVVSHEDGVVDVIPGESCPPDQRDRGPVCDHCQRRQPNRKKTMVLRNDAGQIMQVGTTCIGDFLGSLKFDPQLALSYAAAIFSLVADMGMGNDDLDGTDHDGPGGFRRVARVEDIETILAWTGGWLHDNQWISGGKAFAEDLTPTRAHVADLIWPPRFSGRFAAEQSAAYEAAKDKAREAITDELREEVRAAMKWVVQAAEADTDNDYLDACATLVQNGFAAVKRFGYVCSILPSYRRKVKGEADRAARTPDLQEHFGEVGTRYTLDLRLVGEVRPIESDFGTSYLHTFKDGAGRVFKTFASKRLADDGAELVVKATVKKHDSYKDDVQTMLSRVTVLAEGDLLGAARELLAGDVARAADDSAMLSLGTAVKFMKRDKVWRLK